MLLKVIKKVLFNEKCLLCDNQNNSADIKLLCNKCSDSLTAKVNNDNLCNICSHPLNKIQKCESCSKFKKIFYDDYRFLQFYSEYYKNIIFKFKKKHNFQILKIMADMLIKSNLLNHLDYITVVPDNIITNVVKGRSSLCYLLNILKKSGYKTLNNIYKKRIFSFKKQKFKDERHRINEISKIYYLPSLSINKYTGNIILIDDIYTTGATVNLGAELLKLSGFKKVSVITLFRAVLKQN